MFMNSRKCMNLSMRNSLSVVSVILSGIFCASCQNLPQSQVEKIERTIDIEKTIAQYFVEDATDTPSAVQPILSTVSETSTPQLIKEIDFDAWFTSLPENVETEIIPASDKGEDQAEWLYYSPVEYTSDSIENLYVRLKNTGTSTWNAAYHLEYYGGSNPFATSSIALPNSVLPEQEISLEMPVASSSSSWRSCWQLVSESGTNFFDFCYNHGSGDNGTLQSASTSGSGSSSIISESANPAFTKYAGEAPAIDNSAGDAAQFQSFSPGNKHTFCAQDHTETWQITFTNTGNTTWDSSFTLNFYSGYNWTSASSFPISGSVEPGASYTFSLPFTVHEDNDIWVTCWYLSTGAGRNISDFCYDYYTNSSYGC